MIPKIIHYCWLSGKPLLEFNQHCINSWKKQLKGYEFVLWDLERFKISSHPWVNETYNHKKFAFTADYIRLYAIYHYGGIYLDTDVEVLKAYDDLLHLPYFICEEKSKFGYEAATFGAEKGTFWLKLCMEKFDKRKFYLGNGKYDQTVLPEVIRQVVDDNFKLESIESIEKFKNDPGKFYRFPAAYFSPKKWSTQELEILPETFSIHHFDNSWKRNLPLKEFIRTKISKFIQKSKILMLLSSKIRAMDRTSINILK